MHYSDSCCCSKSLARLRLSEFGVIGRDQRPFLKSEVILLALQHGLITTFEELLHLMVKLQNGRMHGDYIEAILDFLSQNPLNWHDFSCAVSRLKEIGVNGLDQLRYLQSEIILEALVNGLITSKEDLQRIIDGRAYNWHRI